MAPELHRDIVLNGEPIDEPMAAHGPFVMNTEEEIRQMSEDSGKGRLRRISS